MLLYVCQEGEEFGTVLNAPNGGRRNMKKVEFYGGTNCVQICFCGYNWLMSMDALNKEAAKLQREAIRIVKAAGAYDEFNEYDVHVVFHEKKLFVSVCGNRNVCKAIVNEAKRRHFKEAF